MINRCVTQFSWRPMMFVGFTLAGSACETTPSSRWDTDPAGGGAVGDNSGALDPSSLSNRGDNAGGQANGEGDLNEQASEEDGLGAEAMGAPGAPAAGGGGADLDSRATPLGYLPLSAEALLEPPDIEPPSRLAGTRGPVTDKGSLEENVIVQGADR